MTRQSDRVEAPEEQRCDYSESAVRRTRSRDVRRLWLARMKSIAQSGAVLGLACALVLSSASAVAQLTAEAPVKTDEAASPQKEIAVTGVADDAAIQQRISRILQRSGWFNEVSVDVKEGIVILGGVTVDAAYKRWAEQVADQTVDVVAVVNNIEVVNDPDWDFSPALDASTELWRNFISTLPAIALSALILVITWFAARMLRRIISSILLNKIDSTMLRNIVARVLTLPLILVGLYLVLSVTGLARLAATILGGTGILGLVIGIAFRDITENFLASILISVQRPFRLGDHIKVLEFEGFVQAVTTRGTILMTLQGNHVQIPNATIYKQPIINYTANPNMALSFKVGIGYDSSVSFAQTVAMQVLKEHPAVLDVPESLVLTESLDASTVTLNIIFWVNGKEHSVLKVKSAVMRMIKSAFLSNRISMPDDAREVIFPEGIRVLSEESQDRTGAPTELPKPASAVSVGDKSDDQLASPSEGDLVPEASEISRQATTSVLGQNEKNIL